MKIAVTAATANEWMPAFTKFDKRRKEKKERVKVSFHKTGAGMLATAASLMKLIFEEKPDLIIQAGIAGCFDKEINLTKVVTVKEEILGDLGAEENGEWVDLFDLKLEEPNNSPYKNKRLLNPHLQKFNLLNLDEVTAITINEITTREQRILQMKKKYNPFLESMEGAALHYVCSIMNIPFLQLRALSNYIGERNKEKWMMKEAINCLNETLLRYIETLESVYNK